MGQGSVSLTLQHTEHHRALPGIALEVGDGRRQFVGLFRRGLEQVERQPLRRTVADARQAGQPLD
jgi:hypothetical protein